jgi:two-component system response regulator RegX3
MPTPLCVLIVDHDPLVANLLGRLLERDGYEVCICSSGDAAVERVRFRAPDAVVLEVALPASEGLDTCRRLRCLTDAVILLAGPRGATEAAVQGLRRGADDYIGRPYTYELLSSKLRASLDLRARQNGSRATVAGGEAGLLMDPGHRRVFVRDGRCISLTRKEFDLLQFMVENHDRVISADDILVRVWGPEYLGDRDLVKQFIHRLRSKLDADPGQPRSIVTVRGSGYAYEPITQPSLRRLLDESTRAPSLGMPATRDRSPALGAVSPSAPWRRVSSAGTARRAPAGRPMVRAIRGIPLATVALILVMGIAYGGWVVAASGTSLPGDRLYPVKIAFEGLRHALAADDSDQPGLHLAFASERMEEVRALMDAGRVEGLSATLAAFESEMLAASWAVTHLGEAGPDEVTALRAALEAEALHHDQTLTSLLMLAPGEARTALEHARIVLNTGRGTSRALFIGIAAGIPAQPSSTDADGGSISTRDVGKSTPPSSEHNSDVGSLPEAEAERALPQPPVLRPGPAGLATAVSPTPTRPIPSLPPN